MKKRFRLPPYMTMWWARLFALSSLLFLFLTPFQKTFEGRYTLFLLGFVQSYILSVQHGSITFPRNRGGIYKLSADASWLLMTVSLLYYAVSGRPALYIYKLGFALFLLFQFLPLIRYRFRTTKKNYDRASVVFMFLGAVWGFLSLLFNGKAFLHLVFLGFQLHTFLGCMYFMLPRFSRKTSYDISPHLAYFIMLLTVSSMLVNFAGFFFFRYVYLKFAAFILSSALVLFLYQMRRFMFNYPLVFGVIFFLVGLFFAFLYDRAHHVPFMLLGMGSFALGMGYKWYMLHFGRGNSDFDYVYHLSYLLFLLTLLSEWFFLGLAALFAAWVFLNARKVDTLGMEMRESLLNWWRV